MTSSYPIHDSLFPSEKWDGSGIECCEESGDDGKLIGPGIHIYHWPRIWWPYFHIICFQFSDEWNEKQRLDFVNDVKSWVHTIPCQAECRPHAYTELAASPPPIGLGRLAVWKWSVWFHNRIHKKLNRPQVSLVSATRYWNRLILGYYDEEKRIIKKNSKRTFICKEEEKKKVDIEENRKENRKENREEKQEWKTALKWIAIGSIIIVMAKVIAREYRSGKK